MIGKVIIRVGFISAMFIFAAAAFAQKAPGYNYDAQKAFIPEELGKVYLGMPFTEFVKNFDLSTSEAGDHRFGYLPFTVKVNRGNVEAVHVKVHGLTGEEQANVLVDDEVAETMNVDGEPTEPWMRKVKRVDAAKVPDKGVVYELTITFKPEFDQRAYVIKTFGDKGDVRKPDDVYHFYDIQWTHKTSDGLIWLVRSFHEGDSRDLRLIGRIDGTEWDPEI